MCVRNTQVRDIRWNDACLAVPEFGACLPHPLTIHGFPGPSEGIVPHVLHHLAVAHVEALRRRLEFSFHQANRSFVIGHSADLMMMVFSVDRGAHAHDVGWRRHGRVLEAAIVGVVLHDAVEQAGQRRKHVGNLCLEMACARAGRA